MASTDTHPLGVALVEAFRHLPEAQREAICAQETFRAGMEHAILAITDKRALTVGEPNRFLTGFLLDTTLCASLPTDLALSVTRSLDGSVEGRSLRPTHYATRMYSTISDGLWVKAAQEEYAGVVQARPDFLCAHLARMEIALLPIETSYAVVAENPVVAARQDGLLIRALWHLALIESGSDPETAAAMQALRFGPLGTLVDER